MYSSRSKGLYIPKNFLTHAASLHQGCPHCARFLIAASRRSRGRVSVPVRLIILSDQLPVVGLVGRYPTNYLIGRRPISEQIAPLVEKRCRFPPHAVLAAVSHSYPPLGGRLSTCYSTVRHYPCGPFDLHTLGTPLAFVLSQDQTLHEKLVSDPPRIGRVNVRPYPSRITPLGVQGPLLASSLSRRNGTVRTYLVIPTV